MQRNRISVFAHNNSGNVFFYHVHFSYKNILHLFILGYDLHFVFQALLKLIHEDQTKGKKLIKYHNILPTNTGKHIGLFIKLPSFQMYVCLFSLLTSFLFQRSSRLSLSTVFVLKTHLHSLPTVLMYWLRIIWKVAVIMRF